MCRGAQRRQHQRQEGLRRLGLCPPALKAGTFGSSVGLRALGVAWTLPLPQRPDPRGGTGCGRWGGGWGLPAEPGEVEGALLLP